MAYSSEAGGEMPSAAGQLQSCEAGVDVASALSPLKIKAAAAAAAAAARVAAAPAVASEESTPDASPSSKDAAVKEVPAFKEDVVLEDGKRAEEAPGAADRMEVDGPDGGAVPDVGGGGRNSDAAEAKAPEAQAEAAPVQPPAQHAPSAGAGERSRVSIEVPSRQASSGSAEAGEKAPPTPASPTTVLSREERKIQLVMQSFQKMEERQRKREKPPTPKTPKVEAKVAVSSHEEWGAGRGQLPDVAAPPATPAAAPPATPATPAATPATPATPASAAGPLGAKKAAVRRSAKKEEKASGSKRAREPETGGESGTRRRGRPPARPPAGAVLPVTRRDVVPVRVLNVPSVLRSRKAHLLRATREKSRAEGRPVAVAFAPELAPKKRLLKSFNEERLEGRWPSAPSALVGATAAAGAS